VSRRPPRLEGFNYKGPYIYSLTASTYRRQHAFAVSEFAGSAAEQLLQHAGKHGFKIIAYCLMPDHVHVELRGLSASADMRKCFESWRQWTGFRWKRSRGIHLWEEGYWDYVLRQNEDPVRIAAYIINNPVRAGLVSSVFDYPYVGSSEHSLKELADAEQGRPDYGYGRD
jgi:REP-associated tyrosine transposase